MIPLNVPFVPDKSKQYVLEALEGNHQQGDGIFTARVSKMVSDLVGGGHVLLTPSCTHALEMASMLANLGPGDEVIMPSFTFTSAATAVSKFGAIPVFVDIDMETKGIDVNQVREAITLKTKAISWVNYAGVAPDLGGLQSVAKEFNLLLIEDNAHGLGGTYKGKALGSFGDFSTQSFHATKNIQCGEGGALVINNKKYIDRAEIIREKGTDRSKFFRGEVNKYQWMDQGSSYLLAESLAAILLGQLEIFEYIQTKRQNAFTKYGKIDLTDSVSSNIIKGFQVSHMFFLQFEKPKDMASVKLGLNEKGVGAASHYQPLHLSKFGKQFSNNIPKNSNTTKISSTILRFPLWPGLTELELIEVIEKANFELSLLAKKVI